MATTPPLTGTYTRATASRRGYFFWMAALQLAIVAVGFSPTLYLRPVFDAPPMPAYLYLHGAVLTLWFVWFLLQASLVATRRTDTHRRLGVAGAVIAGAVVLAGPLATFNVVARARGAGLDWDTDMSALPYLGVQGVPMIDFISRVVWTNWLSVIAFAVLVAAAIAQRGSPQVHKRLMLLASLAIIAPALARIARLPGMGGEGGPLIPLAGLALLASVVAYDLVRTKRVHSATIAGIATIVVSVIVAQILAGSAFGQAVVRAMG